MQINFILNLKIYQIQNQIPTLSIIFMLNNQAPKILSIIAIFLGLYIALGFLFSQNVSQPNNQKQYVSTGKNKQEYHVGCFLNDESLNQYEQLSSSIKELKRGVWKKVQQQTSLIPIDYMEKKGLEVARSFENFIAEFEVYNSKTRSSTEVVNLIKSAYQDFRKCKQKVDDEYSSSICEDQWSSYSKCSNNLDALKNKLKIELSKKQEILQKIKLLLSPSSGNDEKIKQFEEFEKNYQLKYKLLKQRQQVARNELKIYNEKQSHAEYQYNLAQNGSIYTQKLYQQCAISRLELKYCEELSQQMRKFGQISLPDMSATLEKKRERISHLKVILHNMMQQDNTVEIQDLKKTLEQDTLNFKKFVKLFAEIKIKFIKNCGCTIEEEESLRAEALKAKSAEQEKYVQFLKLSENLQLKQIQLKGIQSSRNALDVQFETELKKLKGDNYKKYSNTDQIAKIKLLQTSKLEIEINIHSLQSEIKALELSCWKIKSLLSFQIDKISNFKDCLNKYQYYVQLKKRLGSDVSKQINFNQSIKKRFIQNLQEFQI